MKRILILIGILCALKANSQDYYITFSGAGESSSVETVSVENLTSGILLVMNGSDILHLTNIVTGNHSTEYNISPGIRIYPNPVTDNSMVEICPPEAGNARITILDMTGKPVTTIQSYLEKTKQSFRLSGIKNGFYLINVKGNNYQFSGKLLSGGSSAGIAGIEKQNSIIQTAEEKPQKARKKGALATVDMAYTPGDRLKFFGKSGIYRTVKTDIPASDETVSFNFYKCTDGDNNNYPVVEIGNQVWMAENLKTTRYNDGSLIPYVTDDADWLAYYSPAYCWYSNDEATNKDTYGALYKFYAISPGTNGNRNVCPIGWHVGGYPSTGETPSTYRTGGYLRETGTTHWLSPNIDATNEWGYTALPAGKRASNGVFSGIGAGTQWWTGGQANTHGGFDYPRSGEFFGLATSSLGVTFTDMVTGFSVRCKMGEAELPIITTSSVSFVTLNTATSGGNVISDGGLSVTRGICWSTLENPTIANNKTIVGTGIGEFESSISELIPGTIYYVKAYATNSMGTAYGNQIIFSTKIADIEENTYNTVTIGAQVWMAENLKTTKYNDGTIIPLVTDNTVWSNLTTPGYCWFNNDQTSYKPTYGALYNWYSVNTGKLCPTGWHVPSDADWTILSNYWGGEEVAGGKLKEAGTAHWLSPNTGATNERGFTALPAGNRTDNAIFYDVGNFGYWWSVTGDNTTSAWLRYLSYNSSTLNKVSYDRKSGFSIRCLKNDYPDLITESITSVTSSTATSGGNITSEGGGEIVARGICWSTAHNPTIANTKTTEGSGTGHFISSIIGLSVNTTYYVRAYATNSFGTNYGNELILKTYTGTETDIDGNVFNTVIIGEQLWMAENLKTTKFNDGTNIPLVTDNTVWSNLTTPGYCWFNNSQASYMDTYGALYNWFTVDAASNGGKNICPVDWRVPNDAEWTILTTYLGYENVAGGKLKEAGTIHWQSPNTGATNESGFAALPGGYRYKNGTYHSLGDLGYWFTSTNANPRSTQYFHSFVLRSSNELSRGGFSIRCLKRGFPILTTYHTNNITQTTATCGGNIISDGGTNVTARGVCWSTSSNPTISDSKTTDGVGTGEFLSSITNLTAGTTYYLRAYATNSSGTSYGNQVSLATAITPTLTTNDLSNIDLSSAFCGGNILSYGYETVTARGVCWSTSENPTIGNNKTTDGAGAGAFTSQLTGLTPGSTYYVRAYATNSFGTAYGNQVIFSTKINDVEGNIYNTVIIGTQLWMAENLKTRKYNDNTTIPLVTDNTSWGVLTTPGYCWYNNDIANKATYGALYNWFTVDAVSNGGKNICPSDWHIPTDSQWNILIDYLTNRPGNWNNGSTIVKSLAAASGWAVSAATGTIGNYQTSNNASGFAGSPGGARDYDGTFGNITQLCTILNYCGWWSATEFSDGSAWSRSLYFNDLIVHRDTDIKKDGLSVRCIKD
jgi:uncharacterized protein (TIGR02145 family)